MSAGVVVPPGLDIRTVHSDILPFINSVIQYIDKELRDPFLITNKADGLRLDLQDPQLYNKVLLVLDVVLNKISRSGLSPWHVMFGTGDMRYAKPSSFDYMPYAKIETKPFIEQDTKYVFHILTAKTDDSHGILTIKDYPGSAIPISPIHINPVRFYADAKPEGSVINISDLDMEDFVKLVAKAFGCYDMLGDAWHVYFTRENTVGRILKKPKTRTRVIDLTNEVGIPPERAVVLTVFVKSPCSFIDETLRRLSYIPRTYTDVFERMPDLLLFLNILAQKTK
jgi:hypothetical protein